MLEANYPSIRHVPERCLGVSGATAKPNSITLFLSLSHMCAYLSIAEPSPPMFGNSRNEPENPMWSHNWLKSRFHFSFAEYHNATNMHFGVLRVMNDDLVQPRRGFAKHSHSNFEICTYVVDGRLTHQYSMGTKETLGRGAIQFMVMHRWNNRNESKEILYCPLTMHWCGV